MDRLLSEMGVAQDQERHILARMLSDAGLGIDVPTTEPQSLAQAIVESEVPVLDGSPSADVYDLPTSNSSSKRRTILLPSEWEKKREKEAKSSRPMHELNELIVEAMNRHHVAIQPQTPPSSYSADSECVWRSAFDESLTTAACPVCGSSFQFPASQVDALLATHIDQCGPRSSRRKNVMKLHHQYAPAEWGDEDEQPELSASRKRVHNGSAKKPARCLPSAASVDDDGKEDDAEVATEGRGMSMGSSMSQTTCADDWEEDEYLARTQQLLTGALATLETPFGGLVYTQAWEAMHEYQKKGCEWMHGLYREGAGGILADEMGLGKTAQACAHFGSLGKLSAKLYRSGCSAVLVVCPATVLQHWLNELHRWAPGMRVGVLHSISRTGRELLGLASKDLEAVLKKFRRDRSKSAGVTVVTTYENLRRHQEALSALEWTAVCLDEGQKIRNPGTRISEVCKALPAFHRIILSGTPIQNSLRELWNLFDFIYPGRLGSLPVFELELATPIRVGGYASASKVQRRVAIECATILQKIIQPYLLRRRKADIMGALDGGAFPSKTEQILFCAISPLQRLVYKEILASSEVSDVLNRIRPAFRAINTLRKLCNHPALVYRDGRICWQQDAAYVRELSAPRDGEGPGEGADGGSDDELEEMLRLRGSGALQWEDSGKLLVLSKILPLWKSEGHKVLIFCQTTSMLGVIESMVRAMGLSFLRMDGQTPVGKRAALVQRFNHDDSVFAMVLTTRTGGLGISLTAANRVILFDPDWNPMTDMQARERAYRLGQKRDVVIYRLLTRGTIEEKIYHRQIFKILLSSRILENAKERSMFSFSDIRDLFALQEQELGGEGESLPAQGRVDIGVDVEVNADADRTSGGDQRDDGGADDGKSGADSAQDRRLLRALFNGDALAAVYDHDFLEPGRISDRNQQHAEQVAKKALAAVQSSGAPPVSRFVASTQGGPSALSSASLLAQLRAKSGAAGPEPSAASSACTAGGSGGGTTAVESVIRSRLLQLFRTKASTGSSTIPSRVVLSQFQDLGDQYAPLFRSTLRSVARQQGGQWEIRDEFK